MNNIADCGGVGFGVEWLDWLIWGFGAAVVVVDLAVVAYFVLLGLRRRGVMRKLIAEHDARAESE